MANDTPMTLVGNLTADPDLRFTQAGVAVAAFTVASTPRTFNRQTGQWEDGEAIFLRCEVWRDMAENVAESLAKGSRVVVTGNFKPNNYTDRDGNQRYGFKVDVQEVGPSLRYHVAQTRKVDRRMQGAPQGGYSGPPQGQGGYPPQGAQQGGYGPQGDPWAGGGNQGGYDDPPF